MVMVVVNYHDFFLPKPFASWKSMGSDKPTQLHANMKNIQTKYTFHEHFILYVFQWNL